jgi:hypothetical protein
LETPVADKTSTAETLALAWTWGQNNCSEAVRHEWEISNEKGKNWILQKK